MKEIPYILEIYKPAFESHFRFHPNGKNIVNAIMKHQLSFDELDQVFDEAEDYGLQYMLKLGSKNGS